jgi:hypothetical protein
LGRCFPYPIYRDGAAAIAAGLAIEGDVDPDLAEERCGAPQPAGEHVRHLRPRLRPCGNLSHLKVKGAQKALRISRPGVAHPRTASATGSLSITLSIAVSRLPWYALAKSPDSHSAASQAVTQRAKSAMRGNASSLVSGRSLSPIAMASSKAPTMRGRAASKAFDNSPSGRRLSSGTP